MNETEKVVKQITEIKDVCNDWLQDVKSLGNETAYSDSFIDRIILLSKELENTQRARGL